MNKVISIDKDNDEIEREVRKMRPPIIGPIMRAISRFFEGIAKRRAERAEKRAQAIFEGRAWL